MLLPEHPLWTFIPADEIAVTEQTKEQTKLVISELQQIVEKYRMLFPRCRLRDNKQNYRQISSDELTENLKQLETLSFLLREFRADPWGFKRAVEKTSEERIDSCHFRISYLLKLRRGTDPDEIHEGIVYTQLGFHINCIDEDQALNRDIKTQGLPYDPFSPAVELRKTSGQRFPIRFMTVTPYEVWREGEKVKDRRHSGIQLLFPTHDGAVLSRGVIFPPNTKDCLVTRTAPEEKIKDIFALVGLSDRLMYMANDYAWRLRR